LEIDLNNLRMKERRPTF